MAARRGKSQARRNNNNNGGMPGWAWMILGIVLALAAVMFGPRLLDKSAKTDGFFRPTPNADARPEAANGGEDAEAVAGDDGARPAATVNKRPAKAGSQQPASGNDAGDADYDFYTLLPGQEVQMTDAQIAAAAKAEQARAAQLQRQQAAQQAARGSEVAAITPSPSRPEPLPETAPPAATPTAPKPVQQPAPVDRPAAAVASAPPVITTTPLPAAGTSAAAAPAPSGGDNQTPYILQAGAFGGSGDAEATKAKIAMLGLNARVEAAQINGKTVYRVRMGPYATASELAEAKGKLANGGLPAMAIKAR